jgi:predicted amidohydrolase
MDRIQRGEVIGASFHGKPRLSFEYDDCLTESVPVVREFGPRLNGSGSGTYTLCSTCSRDKLSNF